MKKRPISRQITNERELPMLVGWLQAMVPKGLAAGAVLVTLGRPTRTQIQNEKFHAMIGDIHGQCFRGYTKAAMKAVLVNQFALEMAANGEPLTHPGEQAWDWVNQAPVYVRPSTTEFTKKECAAFIEFLYATGTELDVNWSEKALAVYAEYQEAA
jgi:hypothetical protein